MNCITKRVRLFCAILLAGLPSFAQATQPPAPAQPGQLANTISAPPLSSGGVFRYRVVDEFGTRGLIGNAFGAAIGQMTATPREWGGGFVGYADRYASGFGQTFVRQSLAWGMESLIHTDPRYFPSTEAGTKARLWNAIRQVYLTKGNDGSTRFGYAKLLSALAAGQVTNAWQPHSNNSVLDGLERMGITLSVDTGQDIAQEFIRVLRPKALNRHP